MAAPELWLIYSTFKSKEEALRVAKTLLEQKLIACANVQDGVTSLYRWEGAVQQEQEAAMTVKTSAAKLQAAMDAINALHSYDLPCIVAYPISSGLPEFLQWLVDETR